MELRGSTECEGHPDGWGYALVGSRRWREDFSAHYRSTLPVYEDPRGVSSLKSLVREARTGVLIVHSRRLAEGSARTWNTHPIHYSWRGFELWIAHNGLVDSDGLARELGMEKLADTTDTYYLGEYVYRSLGGVDPDGLAEALRRASRFTKTAMNTLAILYDDRRLLVSATSYLSGRTMEDPRRVRYYRLHRGSLGGSRAFFSSSVAARSSAGAEELPLQSAVVLEVDLGTGRVLERVYSLE